MLELCESPFNRMKRCRKALSEQWVFLKTRPDGNLHGGASEEVKKSPLSKDFLQDFGVHLWEFLHPFIPKTIVEVRGHQHWTLQSEPGSQLLFSFKGAGRQGTLLWAFPKRFP